MCEAPSDLCHLRDAAVAANAYCLLSADVDRLDIRPRSIGTQNRHTRHSPGALVVRAREIGPRKQLSAIGRPLGALRATALRVGDRALGAVRYDRLLNRGLIRDPRRQRRAIPGRLDAYLRPRVSSVL